MPESAQGPSRIVTFPSGPQPVGVFYEMVPGVWSELGFGGYRDTFKYDAYAKAVQMLGACGIEEEPMPFDGLQWEESPR
jgi:hypothetical protein